MIRTFVKDLFKSKKNIQTGITLKQLSLCLCSFSKKNVFDEEVTLFNFVNSICRPMKHNFNHTKVDIV